MSDVIIYLMSFISIAILIKEYGDYADQYQAGAPGRVQEIILLQFKDVAQLNTVGNDFILLEVISLPAAYTKGSDAMGRSKTHYHRKTISFDVEPFNNIVRQIEALAKSGYKINPETFYRPVK